MGHNPNTRVLKILQKIACECAFLFPSALVKYGIAAVASSRFFLSLSLYIAAKQRDVQERINIFEFQARQPAAAAAEFPLDELSMLP